MTVSHASKLKGGQAIIYWQDVNRIIRRIHVEKSGTIYSHTQYETRAICDVTTSVRKKSMQGVGVGVTRIEIKRRMEDGLVCMHDLTPILNARRRIEDKLS